MTFETLIEKLRSRHGERFDYGLVERAYRLAEEITRGADLTQPLTVAARLAEWRLDPATIAAAILHPIADRPDAKTHIEKQLGNEVAFLTQALAKLKRIHFTDAAERQVENLRRMVLAFAEDIRVVLIKLAERLEALKVLETIDPETKLRIAREAIEIYAPLANRLGMGEVKGSLEDLAFPILYPEDYRKLRELVADTFEERQAYAERLIPAVSELLSAAGPEPLDVHARAKHWHTLWLKLQKHDMDLEKIYDLVALRIIMKTVADCYSALGALHAAWQPLPGLVKDYIALPKPNGYRSLHTTVFAVEGRITEFQIRTPEMHAEAEAGIAAHWAYDEAKGQKAYRRRAPAFARSRDLEWIRQLSEWQKAYHDPREFLESLRLDFFKNRIFVFTPKGGVIDLPEGATPVDFAYHIHSEIGNRAVGAKANGKMLALDHELKNGDIVEILTQKNKKPSPDWLEFVKTSLARKHIRQTLRRAEDARIPSTRREGR